MDQQEIAQSADDLRIVVHKRERKLELVRNACVERVFDIALGRVPVGDKEIEGDGKTPEGEFFIFGKNPKSKYHLGLGISYPSIKDAERGFRTGLITDEVCESIVTSFGAGKKPPQKTMLGGEIYIHGGGTGSDWTQGCIAMADSEMEELYHAISVGTAVTILP